MKFSSTYLFIIAFAFWFTNPSLAQSSKDSLKISYSKKLIGTWVGKIEMIEKRMPLKDTIVYTYDTLTISDDHTYYLSQGGNTEKHWVGFESKGTWEINLRPVTYMELSETYNNRNLGFSAYQFTIIKVTQKEFNFVFDDRSYLYHRMK